MASARRPRRDAGGLCRALRRARSGRRLTGLLLVYLLVTALIGGRLAVVQVVAADTYRALGERQTQREVTLPAERGRLYDRAGDPLALSEEAAAVYADPAAIAGADTDVGAIATALAGHLDATPEAIREQLTADGRFVYLDRQLPYEVGEAVRAEQLPGVGVLSEPRRRYPAGSLAVRVLGHAGIDQQGLSGLELAHDDALTGEAGTLRVERAPGGVPITAAPRQVDPAEPGADLVLTLDRRVQLAAEQALTDALERYTAESASAVVLDAESAEILAMATAPTFEPSEFGEVDMATRRNRPVTDAFEPGSVAKVATVAAAIEEGVVDVDDRVHLPAAVEVGGKTFRDPHRTEATTATFADMVAGSSNVGTIEVAQRLGAPRLHEAFQRFGFGQQLDVGFPGETSGHLPPADEWWATSLPTIAIGQGVSASLVQLASMLQAVANDGRLVPPTFVRGHVDPAGRMQSAEPRSGREVVSAETAATVTDLLTGVVTDGTAQRAAVDGYAVAGKTGTAQKPLPDQRGYQDDAYLATFVGFAPADDPDVVVAVVLDDPEPMWGGETAAPVFAEIAEEALRARRVPPQPDPPGPDVELDEPSAVGGELDVQAGGDAPPPP